MYDMCGLQTHGQYICICICIHDIIYMMYVSEERTYHTHHIYCITWTIYIYVYMTL